MPSEIKNAPCRQIALKVRNPLCRLNLLDFSVDLSAKTSTGQMKVVPLVSKSETQTLPLEDPALKSPARLKPAQTGVSLNLAASTDYRGR